jgi:hypothetical protein
MCLTNDPRQARLRPGPHHLRKAGYWVGDVAGERRCCPRLLGGLAGELFHAAVRGHARCGRGALSAAWRSEPSARAGLPLRPGPRLRRRRRLRRGSARSIRGQAAATVHQAGRARGLPTARCRGRDASRSAPDDSSRRGCWTPESRRDPCARPRGRRPGAPRAAPHSDPAPPPPSRTACAPSRRDSCRAARPFRRRRARRC